MGSLFDDAAFTERLFFGRPDATPPPEGARDLFVDVAGARLHVRVHEPARARAGLLHFHGNGEVVADYDRLAANYVEHGVRFAVVDYRGYGQSTGAPTLRSALDDAAAVFDAVGPALRAGGVPLIVQGRSLGGMCAAEIVRARAGRFDGVVFESAGSDLAGLVERRGFARPERFTPEERGRFDSLEKVRGYSGALLVLHGTADTVIAMSEGRALFDAAAPTAARTMAPIPGRGHNDLMLDPRYWQMLRLFVDRVVEPRT